MVVNAPQKPRHGKANLKGRIIIRDEQQVRGQVREGLGEREQARKPQNSGELDLWWPA